MFDQPLFGQLLAAIGSRWRPSPAVGGRSCLHGFGLDPFSMHHSREWGPPEKWWWQ